MVVVTMPPAPLSQDLMVVIELAVTEATIASMPSTPLVASAVMTELSVAEVPTAPLAVSEPTSSDDLAKLYASLHAE
ncbi:uncharacterized protein Pyn_12424 [Prunus yedoensis var. nudiflora]|uniref:Uncharacterized protein n=1 Tax=Prunus yedoensis var. nudiflora TaxID=2094558 RepID=A0A314ZCI7_PRUYE|nr:uncharacterized protein Pyn_27165 [Prunus yedoensis var. nudiflora]PQQ16470.1 uncharacterized protein Pyn_12424 [Prunus yedoensis var. nudiflora]